MSSEIIAGRDVRFGAVLSGSGVRLPFKALRAWAHQLPGWNVTSGRAGQDLSRWLHNPFPQAHHTCFGISISKMKQQNNFDFVLQVTLWCRPLGHQGSAVICWCCQTLSPARAGARKAFHCLLPNTWNSKMTLTEITTGRSWREHTLSLRHTFHICRQLWTCGRAHGSIHTTTEDPRWFGGLADCSCGR